MHLLIWIAVILVVLVLAIYAVREFPVPVRDGASSAGIRQLLVVVLLVIAILAICERSGLFK